MLRGGRSSVLRKPRGTPNPVGRLQCNCIEGKVRIVQAVLYSACPVRYLIKERAWTLMVGRRSNLEASWVKGLIQLTGHSVCSVQMHSGGALVFEGAGVWTMVSESHKSGANLGLAFGAPQPFSTRLPMPSDHVVRLRSTGRRVSK